jgi:predicted MPP superfamily phosphohydrolase
MYKNNIKASYHRYDYFNSPNRVSRIIVFSDLHLYYDYQDTNLEKLVNLINEQQPDIVIFNGDLINNKAYKRNDKVNDNIIKQLKRIKPLFGKFAIYGEQDTSNKDAQNILFKADFEALNNQVRNITINNKTFNLIGLLNDTKIMKQASDKSINIVLSHNPINIDKIINNKVNLIVSSHTLGGQYNIPLYGSIFEDIRKIPYYKGTSKLNNIDLISSNGIGIYQSNMRFRAPSTIEVIDIY